jgi:pheromone receptor transcription factor
MAQPMAPGMPRNNPQQAYMTADQQQALQYQAYMQQQQQAAQQGAYPGMPPQQGMQQQR